MNIENKNKNSIISILVIFIVVQSVVLGLYYFNSYKLMSALEDSVKDLNNVDEFINEEFENKEKVDNKNSEDNNQHIDVSIEDAPETNTSSEKYMIALDKKEKTVNINDRIKLDFIGEVNENLTSEVGYSYILKMQIDGKKVSTGIFENEDKKIIWSDNFAANFKIIKIDNIYILISSIAKLNNCSYVLIINENGDMLFSFEEVDVVYDGGSIITINKCSEESLEADCLIKKYKIEGFSMVEIDSFIEYNK